MDESYTMTRKELNHYIQTKWEAMRRRMMGAEKNTVCLNARCYYRNAI